MRRQTKRGPAESRPRASLASLASLTWLLDDFQQVHHVRVVDVLQYLDLARHTLNVAFVGDSVLLEHLDSNPLTREEVHAKLYLTKGALTDGLREQIAAIGSATKGLQERGR